jgi:hypothetical protein
MGGSLQLEKKEKVRVVNLFTGDSLPSLSWQVESSGELELGRFLNCYWVSVAVGESIADHHRNLRDKFQTVSSAFQKRTPTNLPTWNCNHKMCQSREQRDGAREPKEREKKETPGQVFCSSHSEVLFWHNRPKRVGEGLFHSLEAWS